MVLLFWYTSEELILTYFIVLYGPFFTVMLYACFLLPGVSFLCSCSIRCMVLSFGTYVLVWLNFVVYFWNDRLKSLNSQILWIILNRFSNHLCLVSIQAVYLSMFLFKSTQLDVRQCVTTCVTCLLFFILIIQLQHPEKYVSLFINC